MVKYLIDEEYFRDEERCGFMVSSLMKRCWAAQLKSIEDFDRVCSKHGLKWFAFCGTLLGAVRHKGFIPWDDDVDICMLRGDYNMFLRYAAKEMPGYFIETYDDLGTDDNTLTNALGITRINNTHKADFNPEYLESHCGFPYPIGIDLYPLDYVPRDSAEYETRTEDNIEWNRANPLVLKADNDTIYHYTVKYWEKRETNDDYVYNDIDEKYFVEVP